MNLTFVTNACIEPRKERHSGSDYCHLLITYANSLDPDEDPQNEDPQNDPNHLTLNVFLKDFF